MGALSVTVSVVGTVGSSNVSLSSAKTDYLAGDVMLVNEQSLTTVEEALELPTELSTLGVVALKNDSLTDDVLVGLTGSFPFKVRANGGVAVFEPADGATIYVKAASGTPTLTVNLFELGTTTTTTTTA